MSLEAVLLESRTLRASMSARVETLPKVKALTLLPDGVHITTRMVADYFEVGLEAVKSLVKDHREELEESGYRVLAGQALRSFKDLSGLSERTPVIGVFPRRAVLNVAMLLRDSEVARAVRGHLLDAEALARLGTPSPAPQSDADYAGLAERVAAAERMHRADRALIGAITGRLCRMNEDLRWLRAGAEEHRRELAEQRRELSELRHGLGRLGRRH